MVAVVLYIFAGLNFMPRRKESSISERVRSEQQGTEVVEVEVEVEVISPIKF